MTTYNTGNPLGSTDVYDRYDNSENLDNFSNGQLDAYPDRFGVSRQSLQGIRSASQYVDLGPYAAGLVFTSRNQVFSYAGEFYAPGPSITLPYTTTGAGAGEIANFRSVGDAVLRGDLADPVKGAHMVAWQRAPLVDEISTTHQMLDGQKVSIWEFADAVVSKPIPGDPNSWDWTPALQAAADSLPSFELPTNGDIYISIPKGRYKIGSVDLGYRRNLVFEGGVLAPLDTVTARTHMIKLGGRNRILNLTVDADYATNYDTIVWCRGRYIDIISPEVWKAKCVFVFGDPAWEGVPADGALGDSEINILGGSTNWCITNARAYGQNTIVQYGAGHQAYSYKWTLPDGDPRKAAWEALPEYTFINVGAVIYLTGCFTGNYSGTVPTLLSKIQPSDSAEYFNIYGRFHLAGTHIETGKFLKAESAGAIVIEDPKTTMLTMVGCTGYVSSGTGYKIDLQNALQGVDIRGCKFYGAASNSICYSVSADVHIDPDCFTLNTVDFAQTLEVRYPVGFAGFNALDANGTTQTLVPATATLKMPSILAADVHPTFRPLWYSSATGIFTAQTTLRNVVVSVHLTLNGALATDATEFDLYVGGALFAIATSSGPAPWANFSIPKLVRGQTVEVRCGSSPGRACFGGAANFMRISAAITGGAVQ